MGQPANVEKSYHKTVDQTQFVGDKEITIKVTNLGNEPAPKSKKDA
jgi:hypothetical protein